MCTELYLQVTPRSVNHCSEGPGVSTKNKSENTRVFETHITFSIFSKFL